MAGVLAGGEARGFRIGQTEPQLREELVQEGWVRDGDNPETQDGSLQTEAEAEAGRQGSG